MSRPKVYKSKRTARAAATAGMAAVGVCRAMYFLVEQGEQPASGVIVNWIEHLTRALRHAELLRDRALRKEQGITG